MNRSCFAAFCLSAFICGLGERAVAEPPGASPWAQWRGPNGQGVASGGAFPTEWSPTTNVKWKAAIPGSGHSSPIVWGDRVFITASTDGELIPGAKAPPHTLQGRPYVHPDALGADRQHALKVLSFDRRTGALVWERTAYVGRVHDDRHKVGTYANTTPVTDGQYLYVWFGSEGLYCYDFSGKLIWKRSLGPIPTLGMGTGTSPVLYQHLIILQCDEDEGERSFLIALDKRNGREVWRTRRRVQASWTTPILVQGPNRPELVASGNEHVASYDPASGRELWRARGTGGYTIATPVTSHGIVVASAAHPVKRAVAVRLGGQGDVSGTSFVVWERTKGTGYTPSSLALGDYVYIFTDAGLLTCIDIRTGEVKYEGARPPKPARFSASPVAFDNKILITSEDGDTTVVRAGVAHEVLRVNSLDEPIFASPALAGGEIFIRGTKHLYCITSQQAAGPTRPGG